MSLNWRMDKEIVIRPHNGAPLNSRKEWSSGTCDNVDEAEMHSYNERCQTGNIYTYSFIYRISVGDIYAFESGTFHYIYIIIPFIWLLGKGIKSRDKKQIYGCQGLRVGGKCLTTQSQEEGIWGQSGGSLLWDSGCITVCLSKLTDLCTTKSEF